MMAVPGSGQVGERRPQLATQHRVETDRRLVEHQQVRRGRAGRRPATRVTADHPRAGDTRSSRGRRARPSRSPRRCRAVDPEHGSEELAGSRARSGRRTRSAPASRSRPDVAAPALPAGSPSTVTVPDSTIWTPTIARIKRRLAAPGRTEQPGDLARCDRRGETGDHGASAADDAQVGDRDRRIRIHHTLNYWVCRGPTSRLSRQRGRRPGP